MVAGLANLEHQSKILSKATTLLTLEEKFNRLVSLEKTEKLNSHLYHNIQCAKVRPQAAVQGKSDLVGPTRH